ncbi:hypothetical protein [Paracoccus sp. PAR01]|uniref:hypothetical protein n=1 Tax=Paracoccus sp. PAR01 TaxID=2769282 RepID=UPI001CE08A57|nr:hypothetical protein [Paracoccus sp. PAR01]
MILPVESMRREDADKKSRSMADGLVLACSFSTSFSENSGTANEAPRNDAAMFSSAVRFQPLTIVVCISLNGSLGPSPTELGSVVP